MYGNTSNHSDWKWVYSDFSVQIKSQIQIVPLLIVCTMNIALLLKKAILSQTPYSNYLSLNFLFGYFTFFYGTVRPQSHSGICSMQRQESENTFGRTDVSNADFLSDPDM